MLPRYWSHWWDERLTGRERGYRAVWGDLGFAWGWGGPTWAAQLRGCPYMCVSPACAPKQCRGGRDLSSPPHTSVCCAAELGAPAPP